MDEARIARNAGFEQLAKRLRILIARLSDLEADVLSPPLAAE